MRKSGYTGTLLIMLILASALSLWHSHIAVGQLSPARAASIRMVRELNLTDLALFTEAAYIRHLSQADRHTAFQDHPTALEHFPGGGLIPVPAHLTP